MKKAFMALMLGAVLLPASAFAHDPYYRGYWRDRFDSRYARPADRGYYCHRHWRNGRLHCHNFYNDPHRVAAERAYPYPWRR
jgi:hypothetical protein